MLFPMTSHTTHPSHFARWIAGYALMAGLGTAVITGGAVASADTGSTSGTAVEAGTTGTGGDHQVARRRVDLTEGYITEVKFDDLDANNNKK